MSLGASDLGFTRSSNVQLQFSPVNIMKDPPQIATEGFSMGLRPEGFLE